MSDIWDRLLSEAARKTFVLWVLFFVAVAFATYVVLRIHVTYQIQRDLALLKASAAELAADKDSLRRDCAQRLDVLEQTLFGEVLPKQGRLADVPQANTIRLSRIEVYQQNTNKELRARLERLERWRLDHVRGDQEHP